MFEAASWLDFLAGIDPLAWAMIVIAPFVGSFLGVLVRRLPEGRPILWARSRCETCGTALSARDLIPFAGWLVAGGRCRFCAAPLGWFDPAIELAATAVAVAAVAADGSSQTWLDCAFGWWLLALGCIDLRCWLLPDALTLPLVIAGLAAVIWLDPARLTAAALGAALGYLGLRLVGAIYRVLRGHDGIGGGDAKLLAASGAWLGAGLLPQVILLAASTALAAALCLRLAGIRLGARSALPFGPFLAFATWFCWLFAR
jgi:leader peptidase (prepilin peptidase) / N-methyltransferase